MDKPHYKLNLIYILNITADETNNFISGVSNNLELQLVIILIILGNNIQIEARNTLNLLKNAGYLK